jgi:hypothetical protein
MTRFDLYLIKSHKQIPIDPQLVLAKKHAHYASVKESSNQVASFSNKFLNPSFDSNKVPTSKQIIINTYSSFNCKFKL